MIVVNLFGSPGSGKSVGAAFIFSQLKMLGVNVELITEAAKEKVWENNIEALSNQPYMFGLQSFSQSRCRNKVDVIVTDSPLPLSILYNKDEILGENFYSTIMDVFNSYNNMNYLIHRVHDYNPSGRIHSEEESNEIHNKLVDMLKEKDIVHKNVNSTDNDYMHIVTDVYVQLQAEKLN